MKMLMTFTISMILEMYSIFYGDSNSCYIMDCIDMYHVLLLTHTHTYIYYIKLYLYVFEANAYGRDHSEFSTILVL